MYNYKFDEDTSKKIVNELKHNEKAFIVDIVSAVKNVFDSIGDKDKDISIDFIEVAGSIVTIPLAFTKEEIESLISEKQKVDKEITRDNFSVDVFNEKLHKAIMENNLADAVKYGNKKRFYIEQLEKTTTSRENIFKSISDKELDFKAQFAELDRQLGGDDKDYIVGNFDDNVVLGYKICKAISILKDRLEGADENIKRVVLSNPIILSLLGKNDVYLKKAF